MFNLIQQYMGDVSLWQLAGELILVILGIMATIAVWRAIKPSLKTHSKSLGALLWQRLCNEIEGIRERRILRQMNRSWRDWQQSELSPVGHKGWLFTIPNLKCLAAVLRTTTGDYIINITHQESGNIFGELIYRGRPVVQAEAKCYDFADVTPKRHAVTARLIQIANGVAAGNEVERFPSNAEVWCFVPSAQCSETNMFDDSKPGQPMSKVVSALTALSNAAAQRKNETSPAVIALALQNGYVVDENKCIVVPYGENTPEANGYVARAMQDLKSAGVDKAVQFSYPDREAVPLGKEWADGEYEAAIKSDTPTEQLAINSSNDNYNSGEMANIIIGQKQRDEMIARIKNSLNNVPAIMDITMTDAYCITCPFREGSLHANAFIDRARRACVVYNVRPTFSYPEFAHASGDGHSILTAARRIANGDISVEQHPHSIPQINPESAWVTNPDAGKDFVFHHDMNESTAWVWRCLEMSGPGVWFYGCNRNNFDFVIGTTYSQGHGIVSTLYIQPAGMVGVNFLRKIITLSRLHTMDIESQFWVSKINSILECVAWDIGTHFGWNLAQFVKDLPLGYGGYNSPAELFQNATTMLQFMHVNTTALIGDMSPDLTPVDVPLPNPVWIVTADTPEMWRAQLSRGNGCYKIDVTSKFLDDIQAHRIISELFIQHRIVGSDKPLLKSVMVVQAPDIPVADVTSGKTALDTAIQQVGEQMARETDRRVELALDDVLFGIAPTPTGREQ